MAQTKKDGTPRKPRTRKPKSPAHVPITKQTDTNLLPVKADIIPADADVVILPEQNEETPIEKSVLIKCRITRDGIKDKDNNIVEPDGNVYASFDYKNEGTVVDIAKVSGRMAQTIYNIYNHMGKGVNKRFPFMLKLEVSATEGTESMNLQVQSRINNPVNTAFDIANILSDYLNPSSGEALLTGNFVVTEEGRLLNHKLGLPVAVNNLPTHKQHDIRDLRRKAINQNVREEYNDVKAVVKPVQQN